MKRIKQKLYPESKNSLHIHDIGYLMFTLLVNEVEQAPQTFLMAARAAPDDQTLSLASPEWAPLMLDRARRPRTCLRWFQVVHEKRVEI